MPVTVIVLAAGQGRRMNSALPKVLQPLAGRPMLAHALASARELEPAAIRIVYGHGGDQVRAAFPHDGLDWCLQAEQLGTGHAVAQGLPDVPDGHQVLVLCGDVPLVRASTVAPLLESVQNGRLGLLTVELENPQGYGRVLRDAQGAVTRIVEERDASDEERRVREVNTGIIAAEAGRLRQWLGRITNDNAQGEYYLTDVIALAIADGVAVEAVRCADPLEVQGINDRVQLAAAERALQRRRAAELLAAGVTLADPERVDVRGTLSVGRDVFIDVGAVFEGAVELGDGVRIGPYAVIADSVLGAGSVVHSHTVMHGIRAGEKCEIGPFARLRPGAALADRVKAGNFVEIKNSAIAPGSKVNHLTYVGDATVGTNVNIGAGTITCNYDGANKHRTVIGDNVFVGSGVMLVAPVEIGDGATIGAGSTITKDTPPGKLTLARSRQATVDGWQRPRKNKPGERH